MPTSARLWFGFGSFCRRVEVLIARLRGECEKCGHAYPHIGGCMFLVAAGTYDCPEQEPCMCIARRDVTFDGLLLWLHGLSAASFPWDEEIPF